MQGCEVASDKSSLSVSQLIVVSQPTGSVKSARRAGLANWDWGTGFDPSGAVSPSLSLSSGSDDVVGRDSSGQYSEGTGRDSSVGVRSGSSSAVSRVSAAAAVSATAESCSPWGQEEEPAASYRGLIEYEEYNIAGSTTQPGGGGGWPTIKI
jgi:hypothetical protein